METNNQLQKNEKTLLTYLAAGITKENKIDIAPIDRIGLNIELKKYKEPNGAPKFGELIAMPTDKRIYAMAETDMRGTVTTIAVALTLAFETLNLKNGMNAIQIVDLAEAIVDSSSEDKIAIEDLMLFLQGLTRGKYGDLYNSMDALKFMGFFNQYRDDRWDEGVRIRDEKHLEYKNLGDPERREGKLTSFDEHLKSYNTKLQTKNDEIRELRKRINEK